MLVTPVSPHDLPAFSRDESQIALRLASLLARWPQPWVAAAARQRCPASFSASVPGIDVLRPTVKIESAILVAPGPALPVNSDENFALWSSSAPEHRLRLAFRAEFARAIASALLELPTAAPATFHAAERGLLTALIAAWIEDLGVSLGLGLGGPAPWFVQPLGPAARTPQEPGIELELALSFGSSSGARAPEPLLGAAKLWLPTRMVQDAEFTGHARAAVPAIGARLASLPCLITVVWGRTEIASGELHRMLPGDVLVFDGLPAPRDDAAVAAATTNVSCVIGGLRVPARLDRKGDLRLSGNFEQIVPVMSQPPGKSDTENNNLRTTVENRDVIAAGAGLSAVLSAALERAPVEVTAELGRIVLRGEELAGLTAGMVLALGSRPSGPVTLTVAGVPVARGALVSVDGQFGVRVSELLPSR